MTSSEQVRTAARSYLPFVALSPLLSVFAFTLDGVYIGATWARDMRNLMLASLAIFVGAWLALRAFGNDGLWAAQLALYAARGCLQALRYPGLLKATFGQSLPRQIP
jgi:multidrug resistance protein, MATE family